MSMLELDKPVYTEAELGEVLGISAELVGKWRRRFSWPAVRFGRQYRFTADQVREILEKHTSKPDAQQPAEPMATVTAIPGQSARSAARRAS